MNCKPGDLAYIVAGQSVGAIVEVVKGATPYEDGPAWECKSRHELPCAKPGELFSDRVANRFRVRDSWLRPISGVPVNDEQRDEVTA